MDYDMNNMASELEAEMNPDVMDETVLQGIVGREIDDAVDYIDNYISPDRALATQYYRGEPFGNEEDGRSQVVSMDVRDTVNAIMPSLMRVFHGSDESVSYIPTGPEDIENAEQATDYANFVLNRDNNGFLVMYSAFKDALIRKVGIVKCFWEDKTEVETFNLTGLDDAALSALAADPDAEITVQASETVGEPQIDPQTGQFIMPPMVHDVTVEYVRPDGRIQVEAVPPEEFWCLWATTKKTSKIWLPPTTT